MIRLRRPQAATRRPHDSGASAVEYALLIAAIGAGIIGVVFALGGKVRSAIDSTSNCLAADGASCAAPAASTPTATTPAPAPSTAAPTPAPSSSSTRGSGNNGNGWGYGHNNND